MGSFFLGVLFGAIALSVGAIVAAATFYVVLPLLSCFIEKKD